MATKKHTVLLDNMYFSNGIVLGPKEDHLLIAETGHRRVLKYHLGGAKKGQSEAITHFPGAIDNIKPTGKGTYIVGVVQPILPDQFNPVDTFGKAWVCKGLVRSSIGQV